MKHPQEFFFSLKSTSRSLKKKKLSAIAEMEVSDVREVLDYYRTFSDPIAAFKENQRVAQEHEAELQKAVQEQHYQKGLTSSWTSSFLRRNWIQILLVRLKKKKIFERTSRLFSTTAGISVI